MAVRTAKRRQKQAFLELDPSVGQFARQLQQTRTGADMPVKKIIQPAGIAEAVGPFSRAILIDDHLYIAGTTALTHISGNYYERAVPSSIEEQTRLTLENIRRCVEAAGGSMDDIFKVVVMLKDPADYTRMNAVRAEYFRSAPPISTCFRAELMREDILVEMDAEALIGASLG